MTFLFLIFYSNPYSETKGNPAIDKLGIAIHMVLEGKEVRFGSAALPMECVTTSTSTGSANGAHDSLTPISTALLLMAMMVICFYGGVV